THRARRVRAAARSGQGGEPQLPGRQPADDGADRPQRHRAVRAARLQRRELEAVPAAAADAAERMIGTNMLQTTLHPASAPRRRRLLRSSFRAALYALGVCAGILLAGSPGAHAQGAPAKPPSNTPPAATPSDISKQLFPNAPTAPPPAEVPGAKQGASDVGKQLFPGAPKNPLPASPDALSAP